jgi:hypothetical protein
MVSDRDIVSHKTFEGNLTTKPVSCLVLREFHSAEHVFPRR